MINNEGYSGLYNYQMENIKKPFFGRTRQIIDRIHSLDEKWYVEFWIVRYFFMGIEVYTYKKEVVKYTNGNNEDRK
ncbi:MAG TPA: hypothetical protein PLH91_01820 [Tenuifilaceae bacterium]|nr:hypothetical protein [Tenuifilaceae bacterium]HPI43943.1 hypothetical protein [Tenuifilaceae bacterium]HPN21952.1 hypothetical protein [Tenuifilaceae bacterium]HPV56134.1 hypothetical protein [Tenuifilaceae bacterium]